MPSFAGLIDRRRILQLLAAGTFLYWLALTIVMHIPLKPQIAESHSRIPKDKTVHFVLYGGLTVGLLLTLAQRAQVNPASRPATRLGRYGAVFCLCLAHGMFEEATQPLTGRTFDLNDFAADGLGTIGGMLAVFVAGRAVAWIRPNAHAEG